MGCQGAYICPQEKSDVKRECVLLHFTGMSRYFVTLHHAGAEPEGFWMRDRPLVLRGKRYLC